jgi:hypothetical protein
MLRLFRINFEVLLMDITFKTNRFQVKLFNIVGVTLLNTTFHLAFVFLTHKETADFTWTFTRLKKIYDELELTYPTTLINDMEPGLLSALRKIFPTSAQLLCQWHINENVKAYARFRFNEKEKFNRNTPREEISRVIKNKVKEFMGH